MSLTRKASSAARKPIKSPRQDLAATLAERDAELAEARNDQTRSRASAAPWPTPTHIVASA